MINIISRSWNNALTRYDVMIVCPKLQGIGVGLDKCWDCLESAVFMLGNSETNLERNIRVEQRAPQYVESTALRKQASMLVGVGTTICTGRRMQVGRPCRICQHHPPRPRDYLGMPRCACHDQASILRHLDTLLPSICPEPAVPWVSQTTIFAFRSAPDGGAGTRGCALVPPVQQAVYQTSVSLPCCSNFATTTIGLTVSRRIIIETSWLLLSVQHESLCPETAIVCGLRKGKDRVQ